MSSSEPSMLVIAIRNIAREIPFFLESFNNFAWEAMKNVIIPLGAMIVISIVAWKILREMCRIMFPPSAAVFHKEALGELKKGDDAITVRQAERLLKKSIKRQPTFLPSHLSLASLQLYQKESPTECLETVSIALELFPGNTELLQLRLDAKAVDQRMGHMVTAGAVTVPYLGDIPMREMRT